MGNGRHQHGEQAVDQGQPQRAAVSQHGLTGHASGGPPRPHRPEVGQSDHGQDGDPGGSRAAEDAERRYPALLRLAEAAEGEGTPMATTPYGLDVRAQHRVRADHATADSR